ncbi:MAG: hypothetical protein L3J84_03810 [Gammaproteobacteria bacterium]|nr:hypothetical protein [Gammaproteobacteria bacterium]
MKKTLFLPVGIALIMAFPLPAFSNDVTSGKTKAQGCVGCHNAAINSLGGKGEAYLVTQMKAIRAGERAHPPVMSGLSDKDIDAIANYLNGVQ